MKRLILAAALFALPAIAAAQAPPPAAKVDAERLYWGRWLEIGRTPMWITDGCVAGATNYERRADGKVAVRDTCEMGAPGGKEKAIAGTGRILDPGTNAKLRVNYPFLITWDYWILDHDPDYRWFIASDPKLKRIFLYTREVPSPAERQALVDRAKALGYDVTKMEFPATR